MDTLLAAAADALVHPERTTDHPPMTPAEEDSYYGRHTLNLMVPAWMVSLLALRHRGAPERLRAARHA